MLDLEIRSETREREVRRLSKTQPISIGRHASNDICIDEADVAPIHCRVSWNRTQFEVASANRDGVDLNGTLVRHASLKAGDVLRIGSADLILREPAHSPPQDAAEPVRQQPAEPPAPAAAAVPAAHSAEVPLKPVTEETEASRQGWHRAGFEPPSWTRGGEAPRRRILPPPSAGPADRAEPSDPLHQDERDPLGDEETSAPVAVTAHFQAQAAEVMPHPPVSVTRRLDARRARPGQQEALRSPFILGMFGVALALALAATAIYFVIGRESAQQQFDAAQAEFDAKHYSQASELFEKFLRDQPRHRLAADANYGLWNARVLKEIAGASPSWKRGLEAVDQYVDANKDRPEFHDHYPDLADFLTQIALGASRSAETTWQRDQLELSRSAESALARYVPDGKLSPELAARLHDAAKKAQDSIVRHERYTAKVAEIEKANSDRKPMAALHSRREIIALYPDLAGESRLATLLKQTLDAERSLAVREDLNKPAVTREPESAQLPHVTVALHTRSRTDEPAAARPVLVLAKDCCYAVDHRTGEPIWRRVIGLDPPFFPISVDTTVPGLLVFDTNRGALMLLARRTGKLIWEQAVREAVSGPPLVDQGQIYLGTLGNHLYKIDLESGRISTRLTFSQKILSPPRWCTIKNA